MKLPPARAPKINQFGHHRDYTNVTVSALLSEMDVTLMRNVSYVSEMQTDVVTVSKPIYFV